MDPTVYQDYIYTQYHLNFLFREWNHVKPHFEVKMAADTTATIKSSIIQCLIRLKRRITDAQSRLIRVIDQISVCWHISLIGSVRQDLILKRQRSNDLNDAAFKVKGKIEILLDKIKGIEPIPFKKLPYELQSRFLVLLPPRDVIAFKLSAKTGTKCVKRRGMFATSLLVPRCSGNHQKVIEQFGKNKYKDIVSISCLLKSSSWYTFNAVCLNMSSEELYNRAVGIVYGDYIHLELQGSYNWKHAIELMNRSKKLKFVYLRAGMLLDADDFDDFLKAMVQCFHEQKDIIMISVWCSHLHHTFVPSFKGYVESLTNVDVQFPENSIAVCRQFQL